MMTALVWGVVLVLAGFDKSRHFIKESVKKMTKRKVYFVSPHGDNWKVKKEGADKASIIHKNKDDAIKAAKDLAKKAPLSQVKIQKKDGQFQVEYTYGNDPEKYEG